MEPTKAGEVGGDGSYVTGSEHDPEFLSRVAKQVANEFKVGEDHVMVVPDSDFRYSRRLSRSGGPTVDQDVGGNGRARTADNVANRQNV